MRSLGLTAQRLICRRHFAAGVPHLETGMRIQYAIHAEDGLVISRVGNELAWPILDYEAIGKDGDYTAPFEYNLEKCSVHSVPTVDWRFLVFTRYLPIENKNWHRKFWGMKPLEEKRRPRSLCDLMARHKVKTYYNRTDGTVGIYHGTWSSQPGLFHWFKLTSLGWEQVGVSSDRDDSFKRELREHKKREVYRVR